jgi:hypothetical protein
MQVSIGTLPALEVQHISTAQQEQQVKAACNHTRVRLLLLRRLLLCLTCLFCR